MDYKEIFQEHYDYAIEELSMDEKEAGDYANEMLYDHYASIADGFRALCRDCAEEYPNQDLLTKEYEATEYDCCSSCHDRLRSVGDKLS